MWGQTQPMSPGTLGDKFRGALRGVGVACPPSRPLGTLVPPSVAAAGRGARRFRCRRDWGWPCLLLLLLPLLPLPHLQLELQFEALLGRDREWEEAGARGAARGPDGDRAAGTERGQGQGQGTGTEPEPPARVTKRGLRRGVPKLCPPRPQER